MKNQKNFLTRIFITLLLLILPSCGRETAVGNEHLLILAHRGVAIKAPENTIASIEMARKGGYDGVEIDVRMIKSGEIILFHDNTLERTTNGVGQVEKKTWDELKRLDAGSYFDKKFKNERIPLLKEVIERFSKQLILYIELKQPGFPSNNFEEKVAEMILSHGIENRTFVASGNELSIAKIERLYPSIQTVWEFCYVGDPMCLRINNTPPKYDWYLSMINPDCLGPHYKYVDDNFAQWAKKHGYRLFPWTVNNARDMKRLIKRGVAGIQTDRPETLKAILYGK